MWPTSWVETDNARQDLCLPLRSSHGFTTALQESTIISSRRTVLMTFPQVHQWKPCWIFEIWGKLPASLSKKERGLTTAPHRPDFLLRIWFGLLQFSQSWQLRLSPSKKGPRLNHGIYASRRPNQIWVWIFCLFGRFSASPSKKGPRLNHSSCESRLPTKIWVWIC